MPTPTLMRKSAWMLLLVLALAGCKQTMFSRLSEPEANEMVALLGQAGIVASKSPAGDAGFRLEVASSAFPDAVTLLKEHGLPRPAYANLGQVFKREGLVSTPTEERIRFVYAQQQELENTLSRLPGVVSARVHVVHPHNDPLADKPKLATASVVLIHRRDADLASSVSQIKALVGHSIEGLNHENVSLSLFAMADAIAPSPRAAHAANAAAASAGDRWLLGAWLTLAFAVGVAGTWGLLRLRSGSDGSAAMPSGTSTAGARRPARGSVPEAAARGAARGPVLGRDGGLH